MPLAHRPDTTTIYFEYDKNGNVTLLTNPTPAGHGFEYNKVNKNTSYNMPLSGSYSYIYDKDRRLVKTIMPSGNETANVYENGRLIRTDTPEGSINYNYFCGSKISSVTRDTESIAYTWDAALLTSETLSGILNKTLSYEYNNDFDVDAFTYAGGTQAYSYDNDGLLTGAGRFTITRNTDNGLPESVSDTSMTLTRTFSGYGEADGQSLTVGGQNLAQLNLTRDNTGRITEKTETFGGITSYYVYTYDETGRLLTVTKDGVLTEEYQYNANGSRIYEMNTLRGIAGRSMSYSEEDHLLTAGDIVYDYNEDGFLTAKTDGAEVTTYDYSSRGELMGVSLPDGTSVEYLHDPLGRRIAKKVNGAVVEKYLWSGLTTLLAVYDGSDNLLMRFEYADSRMPFAVMKEGVLYYPAYDQVGSLKAVADGAGNVVKRVEYDSFGSITADSDALFEIPFGFAGGLHDRDTGLVRFGYRDYDPETGRWTAKDPIGFAGGDTDLFGYCLNDPINLVDPNGLMRFLGGISDGDYFAAGASVVMDGIQSATKSAVNSIFGLLPNSVGVEVTGGIALPGFDGISTGYNWQYGGESTGQYTITGVQKGVSFGAGVSANLAWGQGSWAGDFPTLQGNIGSISFGYFDSPGWSGISIGWGIGAPFGLMGGNEFYVPVPCDGK